MAFLAGSHRNLCRHFEWHTHSVCLFVSAPDSGLQLAMDLVAGSWNLGTWDLDLDLDVDVVADPMCICISRQLLLLLLLQLRAAL